MTVTDRYQKLWGEVPVGSLIANQYNRWFRITSETTEDDGFLTRHCVPLNPFPNEFAKGEFDLTGLGSDLLGWRTVLDPAPETPNLWS